MTRALLIGEAPSATSDPTAPLSGRTGARIEHFAGLAPGALASHFDLLNLLDRFPGRDGKGTLWPVDLARESAKRIAIALEGDGRPSRAIFLGKRVAAAFGERRLQPCRWAERRFGGRVVEVALLPHPSGVNRWFNDPKNVKLASEFLFEASAPEAP
jgi:uracil-DNA glycosylase